LPIANTGGHCRLPIADCKFVQFLNAPPTIGTRQLPIANVFELVQKSLDTLAKQA
jgi:hypothetical protein